MKFTDSQPTKPKTLTPVRNVRKIRIQEISRLKKKNVSNF